MTKYTQSKVLNNIGLRAVYLFIAELNGFKAGTVDHKIECGRDYYYSNTVPVEQTENEHDDKEFHETIWLLRIYEKLDQVFGFKARIYKQRVQRGEIKVTDFEDPKLSDTVEWDIPIELDASASMLQYMGILLNDKRLTSMTNVIGDQLSDPWAFEGIPRGQFKKAATPMLYGSSRACHELWQDGKFEYTLDQVKAFNTELSNGAFGVANAFKEFIINYCKPQETMQVNIFNESFQVECNRFRNIGEKTTMYDLFDTETKSIRRLHHTTTKKVADLEQFRRYFVTLLIHNLDSQVADKVIGKVVDKYGWGLDIHDAFIVHPNSARDVREWYSEELTNLHTNRKTILANYFKSIGIGKDAQKEWERVTAMVHPIEGAFKANRMALK